MKTLKQRFNVDIPKGILFYPCCGNDIAMPLELFMDTISEYHFVDINHIILPNEEYPGRLGEHRELYRYICNNLIKDISQQVVHIEKEQLLNKKKHLLNITQAIKVPKENYIKPNKWIIKMDDDTKELNITRHKKDALITLTELDKIAVFYYCGDSLGEGGSGQWWLGPDIFSMVLDKLVYGGIVVTDGSNPDPDLRNLQENKPLWKNSWIHKDQKILETPRDFLYQGRSFKLIGQCGHKYGPIYAWQVK